jgi:flagellin
MSIVINTNTQSIFAQRALSRNTLDLQRNIEHLSTGFKINRAADDAAGLSISNKLTTKIRGFEKAKQNAGDGISLIQTAEGALGIVQENMQRIRELIVQGVNGTFSSTELDAFQREINERIRLIDDISQATEFNGIQLLTGNNNIATPPVAPATTHNVILQTGADSGQITTLNFASGITANTGININVDHETNGTTVDFGELNEGITVVPNFALSELQLAGATVDSLAVAETRFAGAANEIIDINGTGLTLADIDTVIDNISRMRSELGAMQNALQSKIEYLDIARENAEASRSRIKDVDVAKESSMLVKNQILQQSAAAMLAQANSSPQLALQLLSQSA